MITKEGLDDWHGDEGESPFEKPESSLYQLPYLVIRTSTLKTMPVGWQKSLNLLLKNSFYLWCNARLLFYSGD
jgi:hypothetical protein